MKAIRIFVAVPGSGILDVDYIFCDCMGVPREGETVRHPMLEEIAMRCSIEEVDWIVCDVKWYLTDDLRRDLGCDVEITVDAAGYLDAVRDLRSEKQSVDSAVDSQ